MLLVSCFLDYDIFMLFPVCPTGGATSKEEEDRHPGRLDRSVHRLRNYYDVYVTIMTCLKSCSNDSRLAYWLKFISINNLFQLIKSWVLTFLRSHVYIGAIYAAREDGFESSF